MYGGRGRGGVEGVWGDFWNDLCLCAAKYWELLESACAVCGVVVKPERFTCSILQSTRSCTFLLEMHHLYVVGRKGLIYSWVIFLLYIVEKINIYIAS